MCSIPDHICHVPALFSDTGRCIRVISQTSDHLRLQIFKHLPLIFWVWTLLHPSISASQDLPVLPKSLTVAGADKKQFLSRLQFRRIKMLGQQVLQHLGFVDFTELRSGADGAPRRHYSVVAHGLDLADAVAEQLNVFSAELFH